jgi:hypothetical protein
MITVCSKYYNGIIVNVVYINFGLEGAKEKNELIINFKIKVL